MRTPSIAAPAPTTPDLRAHALQVRNWLISTRCALLACAALWIAHAVREAVATGPFHLFQVVFFVGGVLTVVGVAWLAPYLGALLCAAASVGAWLFLDVTPDNAWLALPAFVVSCLLLHRWKVERTAD